MASTAALNTAGLLLNWIGVIVLFRYGMPFLVPRKGASYRITGHIDQAATKRERLYTKLGYAGLAAITAGTVLQIVAANR